jgi:virginiamycin B lyase
MIAMLEAWRRAGPWAPRPLRIAGAVALAAGVVFLAWPLAALSPPGFTEYAMQDRTDIPAAIAAGPDGSVWFTIDFSDALGIVREGRLRKIPKGRESVEPLGLAVDAAGAAWFTDALVQSIGRATADGAMAWFKLPTPIARMGRVAVGPDGAVWFADAWSSSLTRLKDGAFTPHYFASAEPAPFGVAAGPDGTIWATLQSANRLVRLGADGRLVELDLPTRAAGPSDVAVDRTDTVWFVELRGNKIGAFREDRFVEIAVPSSAAGLTGLAVAPDGSVWFAELRAGKLGRVHDGRIREYDLPRERARPVGVAVDPGGNVWYADMSGWVGQLSSERARAGDLEIWRLVPWPRS